MPAGQTTPAAEVVPGDGVVAVWVSVAAGTVGVVVTAGAAGVVLGGVAGVPASGDAAVVGVDTVADAGATVSVLVSTR